MSPEEKTIQLKVAYIALNQKFKPGKPYDRPTVLPVDNAGAGELLLALRARDPDDEDLSILSDCRQNWNDEQILQILNLAWQRLAL